MMALHFFKKKSKNKNKKFSLGTLQQIKKYAFRSQFVENFIKNEVEFCQMLLLLLYIYGVNHMDFLLYGFNVVDDIDLQMLSNLCIPRINITWSCCLHF